MPVASCFGQKLYGIGLHFRRRLLILQQGQQRLFGTPGRVG